MCAPMIEMRRKPWRGFARDTRGTSAVEFALVSMPFILSMLMILQMGIYYMAKSSLDAGVIQTADSLINTFNSGSTQTMPTATSLKTLVATKSGGLVHNDSTLLVALQQFATLSVTVLPIIDGTIDTGTTSSVLELRAQSSIPIFVPGMGSLAIVRSSALVRRQGY